MATATAPHRTTPAPSASDESAEAGIPTWVVFVVLTLLNIAVGLYVKEFVLTPELYRQLFGDRLDSATIDEVFQMTRKTAVLGYATSPLVVWLRVAFFALMLQFALLVFLVEIPFRKLFAIACWGYFMPLLGAVAQWAALTFRTDAITERDLRYVPGSIADFMDPVTAQPWLYDLMSRFSIAEAGFCIVIAAGLYDTRALPLRGAIAATAGVWLSINLLKWAVMFWLQGLAPG